MQLKALISTLVFMGNLTLITAPIQAASITDTDSFSDALTELVDQPLRVNLFDSSLGNLTGVTVTLSGSLTSQGEVTNTTTQAQSFTYSTRAERYDGTSAAGSPAVLPSLFPIFNTPPTTLELIGSQTYTNLDPNVPTTFGPFSESKGPLTIFSSTVSADLADFMGVGVFGYDFNTKILPLISGDGNVDNTITTRASATLSVTYEFNEDVAVIPEPTTISLLGLGLLGLAYARHRQSRKA